MITKEDKEQILTALSKMPLGVVYGSSDVEAAINSVMWKQSQQAPQEPQKDAT